ncbi:chalcone isomerase family protein [uncultured Piscinibacter sp.]|uniref:chalcone isomerase family protein n=1 Tax=uncultured Piscinibacter sp. TaxID=1131835 RepID=UPI0026071D3E|nr:chalcone isomerase family protein [uncultured Piscinibacter sp.]
MRYVRSLCLSLLLAVSLGARAAVIEGQHFEDRIRLADTELVLNGVGLRAVAWFKGYAAGLYVGEKSSSPDAVLAQKGPKRVRMRMMVEVESKEFVKAFDKGMRRNLGEAERAALRDRIDRFDRTVAALVTLKKGDVVDLDYLPARGLVLSVNGQQKGDPFDGEAFFAAILKIFIGSDPVDSRLKAGLLGKA